MPRRAGRGAWLPGGNPGGEWRAADAGADHGPMGPQRIVKQPALSSLALNSGVRVTAAVWNNES